MDDIWREIEDFPGYVVDDLGRVMSLDRRRILRTRFNRQGFAMVNLGRDAEIYTRSIAKLVAEAFIENPYSAAYNSIIHLNGDRGDCRAMNLMWRPRWFSIKYHKMFEVNPIRVAVYIPKLDKIFSSLREFCTTYGLIEEDAYHAMFNQEPCFYYGWFIERYEECV